MYIAEMHCRLFKLISPDSTPCHYLCSSSPILLGLVSLHSSSAVAPFEVSVNPMPGGRGMPEEYLVYLLLLHISLG